MNWQHMLSGLVPSRLADLHRERRRQQRLHAERVAFYGKLVGRGDLVFDVGANIGERVAALLELGCRVVAVEPQAACIERLRRIKPGSGSLVIVAKACGAESGELLLRSGGDGDVLASLSEDYISTVSGSGRFATHRWDHEQRVEVTTLNALIAEHGAPTFIKIDVEGFESKVLAGLSSAPPVLSFEFTPELGASMRECIRRCTELGLREFNLSFGESMVFARPEWVGPERMLDIVGALEGDRWLFGDIFARRAESPVASPA